MAANYDFVYNSENLDTLINRIGTSTNNMWDYCEKMIQEVGNMEDSWGGDSYTNFRDGVQKYEPAIRAIPVILATFGDLVLKARDSGDALVNDVKKALDLDD